MLPSGPGSAPITAAHFMPAGSCPQGSMRRYGPGGIGSDETAPCVDAVPSKTVIARTTADAIVNTSRHECDMQASHQVRAYRVCLWPVMRPQTRILYSLSNRITG